MTNTQSVQPSAHLSAHLSEDHFSQCLIDGIAPPECRAHLDHCDHCSEELSSFMAAAGDFSRASLAWGEARSTTLLRPVPGKSSRHAVLRPAAWVLAAMAALAAALPVWNHGHQPASTINTSRAVVQTGAGELPAEDSEVQIAQDNQLLQSVNLALAANESSPLAEYHLADGSQSRSKTLLDARGRP